MQLRRVFIISDLHLGGELASERSVGFQMCPSEARRRLVRFINWVAKQPAPETTDEPITELVINGDFLDFLAEQPFVPFTAIPQAVDKLNQAITNIDSDMPENDGVFDALHRLVSKGHRLTMLVGNHDVELSLPTVRRALLEKITKGQPAHIEFLFDGEAYAVGDLLIEHGNRYDGWNALSYGQLRAYRAELTRSEQTITFVAPPGSFLVTKVMNQIKQRYRFIDLLKPENEATLPILIALEPAVVGELRQLVPLALRSVVLQVPAGRVPRREAYIADASATAPLATGDEEMSKECAARTQQELAWGEQLLVELEQGAKDKRVEREETQIAIDATAWLKSSFSLFRMGLQAGDGRYRHLRDALAVHRQAIGTTFELTTKDPIYYEAAKRLSGGHHKVVAFGHTHLAKSIELPDGGRYLNSGTWCPTIRLAEQFYQAGDDDPRMLDDLRRFVDDLAHNRLAEWTRLATTFIDVTIDQDGRAQGRLWEFKDEGPVPLEGHSLEGQWTSIA